MTFSLSLFHIFFLRSSHTIYFVVTNEIKRLILIVFFCFLFPFVFHFHFVKCKCFHFDVVIYPTSWQKRKRQHFFFHFLVIVIRKMDVKAWQKADKNWMNITQNKEKWIKFKESKTKKTPKNTVLFSSIISICFSALLFSYFCWHKKSSFRWCYCCSSRTLVSIWMFWKW